MIELRAVVTRKFKPPLGARETRIALDALAQFEVVTTHANLVLDANALASSEQLQWFDALIVEAAIRSGCRTLYSEDLAHGRVFASLTVRNPLAPDQV